MLKLPPFNEVPFINPFCFFLLGVFLCSPFVAFSSETENLAPTQIFINGVSGTSSISISENLPAGTLVGTLTASDTISGSTHSFSFVPSSANDNDKYQIIGNQLYTTEVFDYESQSSHMITIRAISNADGDFLIRVFTITILDVDLEVPPVTSCISYTLVPPTLEVPCSSGMEMLTGTTSSSPTITTLGTHLVVWTFTCSDLITRTTTQVVVIEADVTPPTIPTLPTITAQCSVTLTPPNATDSCSGLVTGTTSDSIHYDVQGNYTVVWTFEDLQGNTSSTTQSVVIADLIPPVVPSLPTVHAFCSVTVTPTVVIDNCGATVTGTTANPFVTGTGSQVLIWNFTDPSGNTTLVSQTVVIEPENNAYLQISPAGTESQTVCSQTGALPFEDIVYAVATNSSTPTVLGLPDGISSLFDPVTRELRIFGTLSSSVVPQLYTYAITSQVNSCTAFFEGYIEVTTEAEINLLTSLVTEQQVGISAVCAQSPIQEIHYEIAQAETVQVTGLPPGISYERIGDILRIYGNPEGSIASIQRYTYQVSTTDNLCGLNVITTGEIEVIPLVRIDEDFIRSNDIEQVSCAGGNDGSIRIPEDPLQFQNRITGNANHISQVDQLVFSNTPALSDVFSFELNGEVFEHTVIPSSFGGSVQSLTEIAQVFVDAINSRSTEVLASLTATSTITLRAISPGVPFTIDHVNVQTLTTAQLDHSTVTPNQVSAYSYSWTGPNGFVSSQLQIENLRAGTYTIEVSLNNCTATTASFEISEPSPVVLDTNFCNGSFELDISGGVAPYTVILYDSNNVPIRTLVTNEGEQFPNLTPGAHYLVEVKDAQCAVAVQTAIEMPFELSFDASVVVFVDDYCNNNTGEGAIELGGNAGGEAFSGGSHQYSYRWVGPNFTANTRDIYNLNPGYYTVTVTDIELGCQHQETFEILSVNPVLIEPTSLTVYNSQGEIELACAGDETALIEVAVSGGSGNYSYVWTRDGNTLLGETQNRIDDLGVGLYELTVLDAPPSGSPTGTEPCAVTSSFEVVSPQELSILVNEEATNTLICPGENNSASYEIEVLGGTPPFNVMTTAEDGTEILTEVDQSRKKTITGLNPSVNGNTYSISVSDANNCVSQAASATLTFSSIEAVDFRYRVEQIDCVAGTLGSIQLEVVSGSLSNEDQIQVNWKSDDFDLYDTWANGNGRLENIATAGSYQVIITQGSCELYRSDPIEITNDNNNQLYINDIQVNGGGCNGSEGSITLDIRGGYPPLNILWEAYRAVTTSVSGTGSDTITNTNLQWVALPQFANNAVATGLELGTYRATVSDGSGTEGSTLCNQPQQTPDIVIGTSVFDLANFQVIQENICEAENATISFSIRNSLPNPNNNEYTPRITLDGNNPGSNLIDLGNLNYKISNISEGMHTLNITTGTSSAVLGDFASCAIAHPFSIEALEPIQYSGETQFNFSPCDTENTLALDLSLITGGTPFIIDGAAVYDFSWTFTPQEVTNSGTGVQNFVGDRILNPAPGNYELVISDSENCSTDPILFTVTQEEGFEAFQVAGTLRENSGTGSATQSNLVKVLPPDCSGNQSNGQIGISISGGLSPYVIEWYREDVSVDANYVLLPGVQNSTHLQNLTAGNYKLIIRSQNSDCEVDSSSTTNRYYEEIFSVPNSDDLRLIDGPYVDEDLCRGLPGRIILELFDNGHRDLTFYYNNEVLTVDVDSTTEEARVVVLLVENPVDQAELVITNQAGCSLSTQITIEDLNTPEFEYHSPSLQFENNILAKEEIEFRNTSTGFYSYSTWNFGDGTQSENIPRAGTASPVFHTYGISGTYLVSLRNYSTSGCFEETIEQIIVGSGYNIIAPNAFSPNGDLINDNYRVLFSGFNSVDFKIYDHLGNLLHSEQVEETDPLALSGLQLQGWNGANAPKNSPYFIYHFSGNLISDGSEVNRSGTFVLIP